MKIARYRHNGEIAFGILDHAENGDGVEIVELQADPMLAGFETTGQRIPFTQVQLLAPVIPKSKIVCVGKNYADHIAEMRGVTGVGDEVPDAPILFLKPNTAVIGPGEAIVLPDISERVEHEAELALVIGAVTKNVSEADALDYVFGYTAANDVTARDLQIADGQWARAKSFDTFCPLGPVIETELPVGGVRVTARVNDELRQDGNTAELLHGLAAIVAYASQWCTMLPGDVILTGTPAGVGVLRDGDSVSVEVAGAGILTNPVRRAQ